MNGGQTASNFWMGLGLGIGVGMLLGSRSGDVAGYITRGATGLSCSFCGRSSSEVEKLLGGQGGARICNRCVELGRESVTSHTGRSNEYTRMEVAETAPMETCSFCGRSAATRQLVSARGAHICGDCLDVCGVILQKGY